MTERSISFVFVGGPRDGLWQHTAPLHATFVVPELPRWVSGIDDAARTPPIREHRYHIEVVTGPDGPPIYFARHESLTQRAALERLVRAYHPPGARHD